MIKIKKNFLSKKYYTDFENYITNDDFPWYVQKEISEGDTSGYCYFTHMLFGNKKIMSNLYNVIMFEFFKKLKIKNLIRAKLNLYTRTEKNVEHIYHVDYDYPHKTALYFINNNNGPLIFKKSNKKIMPEKNKCVIFDGEDFHKSSSCTDSSLRLTLNINNEV